VRRSSRRGAVVLTAASLTVSAIATSCGGAGESEQAGGVTVTREDGSVVEFPEAVRAWCGPFDDEMVDAVHVHVGSWPVEVGSSFWRLEAVRDDLGEATTLPNDTVSNLEKAPVGASLFVYDADQGQNELSSADSESSGTIRVELDGCEPGGTVETAFEGVTLASESLNGPTVSVQGTETFEIGDPPED
jgi:hypothetical protein